VRVESFERDIIRDALKSARGNMAAAARGLETTQRIIAYKPGASRAGGYHRGAAVPPAA
jgi:transcriptional regulator with GAF, ATPase, and Fis domain